MHKGKKKLAIENTYNSSGQWIAHSRIGRDNHTTHHDSVVYKVNQGDQLLVKYSYDATGLVIRKMGYQNDVLIYQCGYVYF